MGHGCPVWSCKASLRYTTYMISESKVLVEARLFTNGDSLGDNGQVRDEDMNFVIDYTSMPENYSLDQSVVFIKPVLAYISSCPHVPVLYH